jgi:tRNA modification GTPase
VPIAVERLASLLARSDLGLHLTQPWKVVIAGRPNAGKSSLMNALLGFQRAIVFCEPGTTRDVLTASAAVDGWPIELADTAGLRGADEAIEAEGVARAESHIAAADLTLLVADVTQAWDDTLRCRIASLAGGGLSPSESCRGNTRLLIVHNKCDLAPAHADGRPAGIEISAKTSLGVQALCGHIARSLVSQPPPPGSAVPFTREQVVALRVAAALLERGDIAGACSRLASLAG